MQKTIYFSEVNIWSSLLKKKTPIYTPHRHRPHPMYLKFLGLKPRPRPFPPPSQKKTPFEKIQVISLNLS